MFLKRIVKVWSCARSEYHPVTRTIHVTWSSQYYNYTCRFQIIALGCFQFTSAQLETSNDNVTEILIRYGGLLRDAGATGTCTTTCTASGIFPVPGNCSLFQACVPSTNGGFVSTTASCGTLNFDPVALACSSSYVCPSCTGPGFICVSTTLFTLCADNGVTILSNYPCPSNYFCNQKCVSPCLNYIPDC